uniref:kelch-like protein 28 n=1 Tax=Styela clava TaxID=7725 RepID=UPI00193AAB79|nr:kelch-like protein 28 [Styela clava]
MASKSTTNLSSLHSVGVLCNLDDLRKHENLCDVSLCVGGCQLSAHKVVLSACSPYFKAMFTQDMAEKNQSYVTFHCVNVDAMEMIIDFAYTGKLQVTASNVQSLVPAACLFQMHLIIDECCQFLESQLHVNNCIGIWRFAYDYGLIELTQVLFKFINQNFEEISKLDEIHDLPVKYLIKILSSDDLNVSSEESVFQILESWIMWDVEARKINLPRLLKCVRLSLLSATYLRRSSLLNSLISYNSLAWDIMHSSVQGELTLDQQHVRPRCAPKLLCAVGGKNGLFATLSSLEIYLPAKNEWKSMAALPQPRYECSAVVADRKLYVLGGIVCEPYKQHSNTVVVWDPDKNNWIKSVEMLKSRSSFASVVLKGEIYVLGGYDGESYLKHVEKFSPRKSTWERVTDMKQTRICFSAAALHDCIYAIGGYGPAHQDSVEMYNTTTMHWQMLKPMLNKRINFGVTVYKDSIYVMGGHSGTAHLRSMEKYDTEKEEWELCNSMRRPRTGIGTAVIDGKFYVVGGHSGHEYLNDVECYDPGDKTWERCSGMNSARCAFGLVAL